MIYGIDLDHLRHLPIVFSHPGKHLLIQKMLYACAKKLQFLQPALNYVLQVFGALRPLTRYTLMCSEEHFVLTLASTYSFRRCCMLVLKNCNFYSLPLSMRYKSLALALRPLTRYTLMRCEKHFFLTLACTHSQRYCISRQLVLTFR